MNQRQTAFVFVTILAAQEFEPRAYSISLTGAKFEDVGRFASDINPDPSLPIQYASVVLHGTFLTLCPGQTSRTLRSTECVPGNYRGRR
jgi:hypothetical protein